MSRTLLRYWNNIKIEQEIEKELNMCSVYSSLIPSYSNYVSVSTEIKNLLSREEKLKEKLKSCMDKHVVLEIGLMQEQRNLKMPLFRSLREKFETLAPEKQKVLIAFRCFDNECRGYIDSQKYKCCSCAALYCRLCHQEKDEKHVCIKADIDNVTLINKNTKPCPKCFVRIEKISGCDQMFCVICITAFDWKTGQIQKSIHNPHYYEMIRQGKLKSSVKADDIPCGGLVDFSMIHPSCVNAAVERYHRSTGETTEMIRSRELKEYSRVLHMKYLVKELTLNEFRKAIIDVYEENRKNEYETQVLATFRHLMIERFRALCEFNYSRSDFIDDASMIESMINRMLKEESEIRCQKAHLSLVGGRWRKN